MILDYFVNFLGIVGVAILGITILMEVMNKLNKNHKSFTTAYVVANFLLLFYSIYYVVWLFIILNGFLFGVGCYAYYLAHIKNDPNFHKGHHGGHH